MAQKIKKVVKSSSAKINWSNLSASQKDDIETGLLQLKQNKGINSEKAMLILSEKYGLVKKD